MGVRRGRVLVLGRGDRAFLSVIRSLGRGGIEVHAGMCTESDIALRSRYVVQWHEIPQARPDDDTWVVTMRKILASDKFDLVIPCNDQAVLPLQEHQDQLSEFSKLYVLNDVAFETAYSKIATYRLAQQLGIRQPRTVVLGADDDRNSLSQLSLPLIVKPPSSFDKNDLGRKRAVARCRTADQLEKQLKLVDRWGGGLVQENFIGTGVGVELLARDGEVLVAFQHIRVHEPLEGGGSSYRRSAPIDPELRTASEALIKALNYSGVAMIEFKVNFDTGQWIFVEINGRFWGSLPLAIAAGVNFPMYLYDMLVHDRVEFPQLYSVPVYCRNLASDQRWLRSNLSADKQDPLLATRSLKSVAAEVIHVFQGREHCDTFVLDDPMPAAAELKGFMAELIAKMTWMMRRRWASWGPVQRRQQQALRAQLHQAKSILFVCKGNICRSPYAERYARKTLKDRYTFSSSGYYPVDGRTAPEVAQRVALSLGVDLSEHRSQVINEALISSADLILTFDQQNYRKIVDDFPLFAERVFAIGLLEPDAVSDVEDPYGGDEAAFRKAYARINSTIDQIRAELGVVDDDLMETQENDLMETQNTELQRGLN